MARKLTLAILLAACVALGAAPVAAHSSSYCGHGESGFEYASDGTYTTVFISHRNEGSYHVHTTRHKKWTYGQYGWTWTWAHYATNYLC